MLNGADALTDKGDDNYSNYVNCSSDVNKSASIYTPKNCLFATFPKELQEAIGARQVKYDSVYNQKNETNLKTTNDKLWLFSTNELADTMGDSKYDHPLEGRVYKKLEGTGDESRISYYLLYITSGQYYSEITGTSWLRSLYGDSSYYDNGYVAYMSYGYYRSLRPYLASGVSVGFTLKR